MVEPAIATLALALVEEGKAAAGRSEAITKGSVFAFGQGRFLSLASRRVGGLVVGARARALIPMLRADASRLSGWGAGMPTVEHGLTSRGQTRGASRER
jgi:hypothetical protein